MDIKKDQQMRSLILETGLDGLRRQFIVKIDDSIEMGFSDPSNPGQKAHLNKDRWNLFIEQVKETKYDNSSWFPAFDTVESRLMRMRNYSKDPLSYFKLLIGSIDSTPNFQLFLAGIDFTAFFMLEEEDRRYDAKAYIFEGRVPPLSSKGHGLAILKDKVFKNFSSASIEELLDHNKICRASFDENKTIRYYIPYQPPMGYLKSKEAEELWEKIRGSIYER